MIRNQYSYWLTARYTAPTFPHHRTTPDDLLTALTNSVLDISNNGYMTFCKDPDGTVNGQLEDNIGSIEETSDIKAAVTHIAADFPEFRIELQENDEDDHANEYLTVFENGAMCLTNQARTIPADVMYDETTVKAIIEYFNKTCRPDIADEVRDKFKN